MSWFRQIPSLVLSLLIAFQAVAASALPCDMAIDPDSQHGEGPHAHHGMHHEAPGPDVPAIDEASGERCCDGGYCSLSGCLSLTVAVSTPSFQEASNGYLLPAHFTTGVEPVPVSQLYRPPALA